MSTNRWHARLVVMVAACAVLAIVGTGAAYAFSPTDRLQETAAQFLYDGNWQSWSNAQLSGGSYAYCSEFGGRVIITFEGTSCSLISRTGPEFGYAAVRVDGSSEQQVSMYSETPQFAQDVFSTGPLNAGRHTIEVIYTGNAFFPGLSGSSINIDAIDVVSASPMVISVPYSQSEESEGLMSLRGSWASWSNAALSGGSYAFSNSPQAAVRIDFITQSDTILGQLDLFARKGPEFGYAKVTLDGGLPHYVDLYASTNQYDQRVYSTWRVPNGNHTLLIEWTGKKNPLSAGTYINVDKMSTFYADLLRAPKRYEQTDVRFYTQGTWGAWSNANLSGGSYLYTDTPGATVSMVYEGWHGAILARTGPEFGIANVYVDGVQVGTVDLYSPTTQYQQKVFDTYSMSELDLGVHKIALQRSGTKNGQSSGTYINIDAADLDTMKANTVPWSAPYEESSNCFANTGGWSFWDNSNLSGGRYAYVNRPASKTIQVSGSQLQLFARKGPEFGYAKITVDEDVRLIDLYAPTTVWQEQVCSTWDLDPNVTHTFMVEWTGLKNPAATGTYVNVDRVEIFGNAQTYLRYEQNDDRTVYGGSWATWSNSALSGRSYAFTNVTGAACTFPWYGYRLDLVTRTGPEFGKVYISLDNGPEQLVDLYSPTTQYQQIPWTTGYITTGNHTVRMRCAGQRNSASTGNYVGVDAFDVVIGLD